MRKKLLSVFGFIATLALAVAFATDKAMPDPAAGKEAQNAAIRVEGKNASDCPRAESRCLRKSAATAQPSDDQNMASSGMDCPKSADCPKADCDKSLCLKHGKAKAEPAGKAFDKAGAESEI